MRWGAVLRQGGWGHSSGQRSSCLLHFACRKVQLRSQSCVCSPGPTHGRAIAMGWGQQASGECDEALPGVRRILFRGGGACVHAQQALAFCCALLSGSRCVAGVSAAHAYLYIRHGKSISCGAAKCARARCIFVNYNLHSTHLLLFY